MDKKIEKKKWPLKRILTVGGIALLVVVFLYTFVLGDQSSKLNVERDRITISDVRQGPFQEFIPVTGTVEPIETFYLDVTEGGRVVTKFVEEGAFLEVGDPIIKMDNARLTLDIIYNQANVIQQENNLRSTRLSFEQNRLSLKSQLVELDYQIADQRRTFETNKELFEKNYISKNEFEAARDRYDYLVKNRELTYENYRTDSLFRTDQINMLEESVNNLQKNLAVSQQQLENLTVRAPIKGQLTALDAEIGQSIQAGQNIGRIDNIQSYKIVAQVDEHYIARVSPGQYGDFTFAGEQYRLEIKAVYPQVQNGRFEVDMYFTGPTPEGIRRGQTVHIKLALGESSEALLVDRGGFYQTTGGQWAFVLEDGEDVAVRKPIRLGRQNPQVFEVLDGLQPGDKVITSSYDNYGDIERLVIN